MPVEVLIEEYKKNRKVIVSSIEKQDKIIEQIMALSEEEKDWISPKFAAIILDNCSPQWIYKLRDSGKLKKIKYVGTKLFVSRSEINQINDKPRFK